MSDAIYRGFRIHYDPPPIPVRDCDWQWVHVDYDGPEDNRYGHAPSFEAAKADIDEWWDDHGATAPASVGAWLRLNGGC